jgi:hypothetical protein
MADSSEIAYLYARICGAFSNMNLAERGAELAREATLPSLWDRYFMPNPPISLNRGSWPNSSGRS